VERERRAWRVLGWISAPYDMRSFIVWTMAGMAQGKKVGREMRRWSEPGVIVIDLAFFITKVDEIHRDEVKEVFRVPASCQARGKKVSLG